ncbi:uncharacterized protein LOC101736770 [Bombyx mori]|uniref:Uncharacterized protein n=1 Tax=Bombyx mori TaxID=7091 RepID=A0A8R2QVK9_BOMMO|nr:uncharacterized protein LOC101736770 [Bombyx mori]
MSFKRVMKGQNTDRLPARGLFHQNVNAITACQSDCIRRLGKTIQLEQEAYLINHPEVKAMLEGFVCKMVQQSKKKDILKEAAQYFTRTVDELECEIKEFLGLPVDASDIKLNQPTMYYEDYELKSDLQNIIREHYPPEPWTIPSPISTTPATLSSSFLSCVTSETTLPTPEPEAQPELTLSQIFYNTILGTVDKAVYQNVDAATLKFDTAYVELQKVVEQAMEIPVIEIREDIAELLYNSYKMFELNIMEKERIAAEIAWEKRMRKKLKKTLRRQMNFKGYETPPTPKSEISSHESYKKPMPKCCVCHPQNNYNRYPKDRFGIYLPRETSFSNKNVTATPNISLEDVSEDVGVDSERADTKSLVSRKSAVSTKSNVSKLKEKE